MKKFVVVLLIMMLCLSFHVSAYASEMEESSVAYESVNEYDMIVNARMMENEELARSESSTKYLAKIKSYEPEQELLYRKGLSDETLMNGYGYSIEQIEILRDYNGERLEDAPEMRALGATLTIKTPEVLTSDTDEVGIYIEWEWDISPIVNGTDSLGIRWTPTFGANNGNMRVDTYRSFQEVTFRSGKASDNYPRHFTFSVPSDVASGCVGAECQFDTSEGAYWAVSGAASFYLTATNGSAPLTSIDFNIAYGHSRLGFEPQISFPVSGGVSWGIQTDIADRIAGYIDIPSTRWNVT